MKIDKFGRIAISQQEAFESLYLGQIDDLSKIEIYDDDGRYSHAKQINADSISEIQTFKNLDNLDIKDFDIQNRSNWFMPEEYKNLDIKGFLVHICPKQNYERLIMEYNLYSKHNMIDVLKYLKYLVDTMEKHNVVWGVGRGSSVASYILFLLGVHSIDSIKYKLDITEFFKEI